MRSGEWCRGDQNYTRTPNFIQIGLTNHSVQYEEVISIIEIMTPTKIFKHHVVFKVLCKSFGFESGYLHVESFFFLKSIDLCNCNLGPCFEDLHLLSGFKSNNFGFLYLIQNIFLQRL